MNSSDRHRIVFYSKTDMTSGYSLQKAGEVFSELNLKEKLELNDFLELYNIKLFFDNEIFLTSWSEEAKDNFKLIVNNAWIDIRLFFCILSLMIILSII